MATLRDAERAREETADELLRLGAHAISVEELTDALDAETGAGGAAGEDGSARAGKSASGAGKSASGTGEHGDAAGAGTAADGGTGGEAAGRAGEAAGDGTGREPVGEPERGPTSFAVVAWFAGEPPADLPHELVIKVGTRTKVVPLRARRAEQFRAE